MRAAACVHPREAGETLISVMVAVALIGIAASAMMLNATNSLRVQQVVRLAGQKEDLRNIFRNSLLCEDACVDLVRQFPANISGWDIKAGCAAGGALTVQVRTAKYQGGDWSALFPPGQEGSMCKVGVVALPGSLAARGQRSGRLQVCPYGQTVASVDFAKQTVLCQYLSGSR